MSQPNAPDLVPIRRALVSVYDKQGLDTLGAALAARGVEVLSTGGTAQALRAAGVSVKDVAEETGFPEMMDGRVKTLHPRIHGALLGLRDDTGHTAAMAEHDISPIDLVVCNLYPFEDTVARKGVTFEEAIEQIDIGGPSMIRSAAKNHRSVAVVTDPSQYESLLGDLAAHDGATSATARRTWAEAAFNVTASYDAAISTWLAGRRGEAMPQRFGTTRKHTVLRYGENPHQQAALYVDPRAPEGSLTRAHVLGGKALSFNNFNDVDAAWALVREFEDPTCVVIKHANPCGAASDDDLLAAYEAAVACDPRSAFGGIVALNRPLSLAVAQAMAVPERFLEVVIAPGIEPGAAAAFTAADAPKWGKNLRLLDAGVVGNGPTGLDVRSVDGGLLVQTADGALFGQDAPRVVTARVPDDREAADLAFAYRLAKHVRSNAIVLVKDRRAVGVGAGQMSRVEATEIAALRARRYAEEAGVDLTGMVVASDAFYPFNDAIERAVAAGARAIVQPGGSLNDKRAIRYCDENELAMWFAGNRHFRH